MKKPTLTAQLCLVFSIRSEKNMVKIPFSRTIKKWVRTKKTYKNKDWIFSRERQRSYICEYAEWEKYYLPIPVRGLTVLDVGAGEGETARFFFEHGAKKVICIEPDYPSYLRLVENAKNKPMVCLNKKFGLEDLKLDFDFLKMDIEGYEEELLTVQFDKPCVIEVHGLQLRDKFAKAGYTIVNPRHDNFSAASYAYRNIRVTKGRSERIG